MKEIIPVQPEKEFTDLQLAILQYYHTEGCGCCMDSKYHDVVRLLKEAGLTFDDYKRYVDLISAGTIEFKEKLRDI